MEDQEILLSLVTSHLEKVSPGLAEEFKSLHPSPNLAGRLSLEEIWRHYEKTTPDRRRLILTRRTVESGRIKKEGDSSEGRDFTLPMVEDNNNVITIQSDSSSDDSMDELTEDKTCIVTNAEEDSTEERSEEVEKDSFVQKISQKKESSSSGKKLKTGNPLGTRRRFFTAEEDQVLMEAIREGKEEDLVGLAKTLNRDQSSVRDRIKKLKLTGEGRRTKKIFTLEEDLSITDAAFEQYKEVKSLKDTTLSPTSVEYLSQDLKRGRPTVSNRWKHYQKVWLLGYYSQTLNKEVRLILANLLVERFETVHSIDWTQVCGHKEFSGHTESSLRYAFHADLIPAAARHFKTPGSNLTLKQIADVAKIKYSDGKKVPDNLRKRQDAIIEYWEGLS